MSMLFSPNYLRKPQSENHELIFQKLHVFIWPSIIYQENGGKLHETHFSEIRENQIFHLYRDQNYHD